MPSSLCMLAYHFYTLSKPVSPSIVAKLRGKGTTFSVTRKPYPHIFSTF